MEIRAYNVTPNQPEIVLIEADALKDFGYSRVDYGKNILYTRGNAKTPKPYKIFEGGKRIGMSWVRYENMAYVNGCSVGTTIRSDDEHMYEKVYPELNGKDLINAQRLMENPMYTGINGQWNEDKSVLSLTIGTELNPEESKQAYADEHLGDNGTGVIYEEQSMFKCDDYEVIKYIQKDKDGEPTGNENEIIVHKDGHITDLTNLWLDGYGLYYTRNAKMSDDNAKIYFTSMDRSFEMKLDNYSVE